MLCILPDADPALAARVALGRAVHLPGAGAVTRGEAQSSLHKALSLG